MTVVAIDLAPEEDVLDGRYLGVIIERWLDDCALRMSPASVTAYRVKIKFFMEWWATVGPSQGWQLREADLLKFNRHLSTLIVCRTGKPLEYNTRKEILGRLRSAFHWGYRRRYTHSLNCAYWVPKAPEGSGHLHLPLPVEDLAQMMRTATTMEFRDDLELDLRARNQALLAVFIGTGARLSEVAGLRVEDVTLLWNCSGDLLIRSAKKVRNREIHQRIACFDQHTGKYLTRWLALRGGTQGPLWVGANGEGLTSQGVYKAMCAVAQAAKVRFGGAHDFRRTFITYFADKRPGEGCYHLLQLQVGHKPQGVTHQLYDLRTVESVRAVFCSPMEAVARLMRD
jgi:integrase